MGSHRPSRDGVCGKRWFDSGPPPIDLRFSNGRHPRLQIWRLHWPAAAELWRAVRRPKVSGLGIEA
jgi:hypothetical protein